MTTEQYQRVKEVFLAVCDQPVERQEEEAARLCGDDAELKSEVDSLLHAHRQAAQATGIFENTQNPGGPAGGGRMGANRTEGDRTEADRGEPDGAEADRTQPDTGAGGEGDGEGNWAGGGSVGRRATPAGSGPDLRQSTPRNPRVSQPRSGVSRSTGSHRDSLNSTPRGRFDPGTVLLNRYRIVSLLGTGGMGEVYRADDLTLDQPVALKFLPQMFENNPAWLDRFHNEVRLSRQVTHPNVCRVFDIGEVDGEQFISMEFVDGEDLASLLRRIGRLPKDKGIEISRQICAGLAAAHDKGVLHRDLKPANIMLDGRGQVRITDFGISGRVDSAADLAAGTPAYMAPEQFTKGEATVRSDIYSLGLVIYEIFTGRPAFTAHSMQEYSRLHRQTSPTHPSTFIEDMDPLAERVILKCLEKDPSQRPGSALAVAASLPGGDPLAAMLAAGETPSPQMVAAAGADIGFSSIRAGILLALTVIGMVVAVLLSPRATVIPRIRDGIKQPEVLADYSRQILLDAGYSDKAVKSRAYGFGLDDQYVTWVHDVDHSSTRWDKLATERPGPLYFWLRQSPQFMISKDEIGMVTLDEPARSVPGMRTVILDPSGRLKRLEVLPYLSYRKTDNVATTPNDFSKLFEAAGLVMKNFKMVDPSEIPPMYVSARFAWEGVYPDDASEKVHIEAASLRGRPVYFNIEEQWREDADARGIESNPDIPTGRNIVLQATLIIVATTSSLLLAWRNIRAGRVDTEGAQKLSGFFIVLGLLVWLLSANHVPELFLEMRSFFRVLGYILVPAVIVWMFYLALEPYVRRTWPQTVISWSRALSGRLADPLVASHVLAGLAVGVGATVLAELTNLIPMHLGMAAAVPNMSGLVRFLGKENPTAVALWALLDGFYLGLLYLLTMVLMLLVLRRKWLAWAGLILLGAANTFQWYNASWVQWVQSGMVMGLILFLLVRYGLVAAIAGLWCMYFLRFLPINSDMTLWYSGQTRFAVGLIAILAIAAATLATGKWRTRGSVLARA